MNLDLFTIDASNAIESPALPRGGVSAGELDALVGRGRQVHDDLLLARARGQVGFGDLYMLGREAIRARDAAESLAARFDNVAVLATGAELDVAASILEALAHPYHNLLPASGRAGRPRVVQVGSADPDRLLAFLEAFPVEQTLFVTLSRSGSDLPQLLQFGVVRDVVRKRVGPGFQDHLVVATDPRGGVLREECLREGLLAFEVPSNVPARFAALTPIGLLPAAIAGIDVRGVLGGAHGAAERTAGDDLRTNPAYLLAAVLHVLAASRGRRHHLFVAASDSLGAMARHVARLYEESVGESRGEPAARRRCGFASVGRDLGSVAARVASAPDDLAVVILESGRAARDRAAPKDAPGLDWVGGRALSECQGAAAAGLRRILAAAGVPHVVVRVPGVTPSSVGALQMAAMLGAAFAGGLAGNDPFAAGRPRPTQAIEDELRRASASAGPV